MLTSSSERLSVSASERVEVSIPLSNEELAAIDGWRAANGYPSTRDAVKGLVEVGLLSELEKVHEFVTALQSQIDDHIDGRSEN